jgi:hypothetical protein
MKKGEEQEKEGQGSRKWEKEGKRRNRVGKGGKEKGN